jgi:hypothetical protein
MEELGEFTLENIEDCTHGIIVFDPESEDGEMVEMVHFVGYWSKPEKEEFDSLAKELAEDDQFGLVDIANRLEYRICSGDELRYILSD